MISKSFLCFAFAFIVAGAAEAADRYEVTLKINSADAIATELQTSAGDSSLHINSEGTAQLTFEGVPFEAVVKVIDTVLDKPWTAGSMVEVCPVTTLKNGTSAIGVVPCTTSLVSGGQVFGVLVDRVVKGKRKHLCLEGTQLYGRYDMWPSICSELVKRKNKTR